MIRNRVFHSLLVLSNLVLACGGGGDPTAPGAGGDNPGSTSGGKPAASGGQSADASGGRSSGGRSSGGGATSSGGASSGGGAGPGGSSSVEMGGFAGTLGGAGSGAQGNSGGQHTSGGNTEGGAPAGGATSGGAASGGTAAGGTSAGGMGAGGTAMGGFTGGTAGAPSQCAAGESCEHPNPCVDQAFTECSSGMERCEARSTLADGTSCGSGQVCNGGACVPCASGMACSVPGTECKAGQLSCDTGTAVCKPVGNVQNGIACSQGVCANGACVESCVPDQPCGDSSSCHVSRTSCASGQEQCVKTSESLPDGTSCGVSSFCYSGVCEPCQAGGSCTPAQACKTGTYACTPQPYACAVTGNMPDGTACGSNQVCDEGACVACVAQASCVPSDPCKLGQLDCSAGPVCVATASNSPDGTACGADRVCTAGTCHSAVRVLELSGSAPASKRINEATELVTFTLEDVESARIAGAVVAITAPEGAYAPLSVTTDAQGIGSFRARLGRIPGPQVFTLKTPGAEPLQVTFTATTPNTGEIFTLTNIDRAPSDSALPAPGPVAHTFYLTEIAVAQDGAAYVSENCRVLKLTPAGELRVLAGGVSCGFQGDLGPAASARLSGIQGLALDEAHQTLYVADTGNQRIRSVNLANGTIVTFAGGGSAIGPGYGDGGPRRSAVFDRPDRIMLGPDGALYVSDSGHNRLRRIDAVSGIVTAWGEQGPCNGSEVKLAGCGSGCDVAWDSGGAAFIAGTICAPGVSYYSGILRRDPDGKLTHIAGNTASNGSTSEGVPATLAYLSSYHSLAFDPAGNLYVSQPGEAKVRRIEGASGRITTVVGTGASAFGGEYASAASAALNNPQGLSSDPSGNLYVVDTNNLSVRQVYRGANTIPSTATLSLQSGDTQTATMGAMLGAFSAKLVDGSAAPLKGFNVAWRAVDFGAGLYAPSSTTGVTGIATATARTGLSPGAYRYEASFRDIHGQHVSGSPVLFSATASTPTSGTIFTLVNINTAESYAGVPGPGPFAGISRPRDVAAGSDGTLYFVAGCAVYRLSKVGHLEIIAGGDLCGFAGETGPALSAKFYAPGALALDEKNGLIYVSDTYNHRVRVVNLADSTIETFAGGGTAIGPNFGDGGPATAASLNMPGHIAVDADGNVYFDDVNNDRLRRVDKATRIISRWVSYITCNGTNTGLASCGSSGNGCDIAFDSNGNAYISSGYMCAPGVNSQFGVVKRAGNGTFTHVAGGTLAWTEGMLATKASLVNLTNIALDLANNLYISQGGSNLLRRIDLSSGKIFSAAGDGAGGYAEYVPAVSARVNYPLGLAAHPNGGVVFADYNNFAFRRIY